MTDDGPRATETLVIYCPSCDGRPVVVNPMAVVLSWSAGDWLARTTCRRGHRLDIQGVTGEIAREWLAAGARFVEARTPFGPLHLRRVDEALAEVAPQPEQPESTEEPEPVAPTLSFRCQVHGWQHFEPDAVLLREAPDDTLRRAPRYQAVMLCHGGSGYIHPLRHTPADTGELHALFAAGIRPVGDAWINQLVAIGSPVLDTAQMPVADRALAEMPATELTKLRTDALKAGAGWAVAAHDGDGTLTDPGLLDRALAVADAFRDRLAEMIAAPQSGRSGQSGRPEIQRDGGAA